MSARSEAIISTLQTLGGWGTNAGNFQVDFSFPLLWADGGTPRRTVQGPSDYCFGNGPDCDPVPLQMPLPANGNTEGRPTYACDVANEDCHVLVVDVSTRTLYELYLATGTATGGLTVGGAFLWDLDRQYPQTLRGEQCTSADAAGLPIAALLPTADEVATGKVGHALRFILPNERMKQKVYVHPATHAGAPKSDAGSAPPYGVRFRLKASFDESGYSGPARVILQALKQYGMILSDGGRIPLTFADDRLSAHKWADLGIDSHTFDALQASDFEVVELGEEIPLTYECARNP